MITLYAKYDLVITVLITFILEYEFKNPHTLNYLRESRGILKVASGEWLKPGIIPYFKSSFGGGVLNIGGGKRKQRSDKKIDVKPTVSLEFKRNLYTFAYLCDEPVKDVAERLILEGLFSKLIIDQFCKWLRRDYYYNNAVAVGHQDRPKLKILYAGETSKISIKLLREDYDILSDLAHALDVPPTTAAGMIIKMTLNSVTFMRDYVQTFLRHLDSEKKRQIEALLIMMWKKEGER